MVTDALELEQKVEDGADLVYNGLRIFERMQKSLLWYTPHMNVQQQRLQQPVGYIVNVLALVCNV